MCGAALGRRSGDDLKSVNLNRLDGQRVVDRELEDLPEGLLLLQHVIEIHHSADQCVRSGLGQRVFHDVILEKRRVDGVGRGQGRVSSDLVCGMEPLFGGCFSRQDSKVKQAGLIAV